MPEKKIGVLLSGCGVFDGSEIHEAVLTLLYIEQAGAQAVCFAPDMDQAHVINHLTQQETGQSRNVLEESARIARGEIQNIKDVNVADLDAVIVPGGFGAAKNLSGFVFKGPEAEVNTQVAALLEAAVDKGIPVGALCIAPATLGMALRDRSPRLTVGSEKNVIDALESIGVRHALCGVDDIVVDEDLKIVTTPAYMLGPSIAHVAKGIEKLVAKVIAMA